METFMDTLVAFATTYGIKIVGAIVVLIVGRFVAGLARRTLGRVMERGNVDPAIVSFVRGMVYYLILIVTVVAALGKFGVETASFIAVLGAAGFAVGFALQGSLSNFAAGVLLLLFRPYKIGDYIEAAGTAGSVREMGIFTTVLTTPDNVRVMVPNGKVFGDVIKNYAAEPTRRINLVIGIGYGSSIPKAIEVIMDLIKADSRILKDPEPLIAVAELADSSVNLVVRPWVNSPDYWAVRFELMKKIKEALDSHGIEIPFPQRVVHNVNASA
jgi:small conductance mechanosensitive channel